MKSRLTLFLMLVSLLSTTVSPAEETSPTPSSSAFTLYEFAGSNKAMRQLDQQLQNNPRFKELGCERTNAGKSKHAPKYLCSQNDGRAYDLFMTGVQSGVNLNSTTIVCPTGCYFMHCPPPSGPLHCCAIPGYQPC